MEIYNQSSTRGKMKVDSGRKLLFSAAIQYRQFSGVVIDKTGFFKKTNHIYMVFEFVNFLRLSIKFKLFLQMFRKRSLSDCQNEDYLDNTRDSVLSDQSQLFSETNNDEPELMIIDFEYCAYNYRGFDLANHFIEWMIDYTNKEYPFFTFERELYPNKEQQVNLDIN